MISKFRGHVHSSKGKGQVKLKIFFDFSLLSGLKVLHKMSFDDIKLLSKAKTGRSGSVFDLDKIGLFRNQKK